MADTGDALDVLADQLGNEYGQEAAAAAWDILNLGERLADAAVWQNGVDSVQAMAAAQSCREARRYLLSPASGRPAQAPQPTLAVEDPASGGGSLHRRLAALCHLRSAPPARSADHRARKHCSISRSS